MKLHTLTTVTGLYKFYLVSLLTQFQLVVNRIMQITCTSFKRNCTANYYTVFTHYK